MLRSATKVLLLNWRWEFWRRGGRPRIDHELRALICRMKERRRKSFPRCLRGSSARVRRTPGFYVL